MTNVSLVIKAQKVPEEDGNGQQIGWRIVNKEIVKSFFDEKKAEAYVDDLPSEDVDISDWIYGPRPIVYIQNIIVE